MKDTPYRYIKAVLATMSKKGPLDGISNHSFERWTQSATFMDAFTRRELNLRCFTRPVPNVSKSHMEKSAKK